MSKPFDLPSAMDRLTDERLRQALAEVKRALVETIGPEFRLILFGSRARGDAEPDSDVDLMVILPDEAYTFENRRTIHNVAADIALERDYVFYPCEPGGTNPAFPRCRPGRLAHRRRTA